jgi:hypothetical protein
MSELIDSLRMWCPAGVPAVATVHGVYCLDDFSPVANVPVALESIIFLYADTFADIFAAVVGIPLVGGDSLLACLLIH